MIKFIYRLFNQHKIDNLNKQLDIYRDRVNQLEEDVREYKGYKLKYEVTKLYVDDDEGLLELFEAAKTNNNSESDALRRMQAQQQGRAFSGLIQQSLFAGCGAAQGQGW